MTAKETAERLVQVFYGHTVSIEKATDCAIIAVTEILEAITVSTNHLDLNRNDSIEILKDKTFWRSVKRELEGTKS